MELYLGMQILVYLFILESIDILKKEKLKMFLKHYRKINNKYFILINFKMYINELLFYCKKKYS